MINPYWDAVSGHVADDGWYGQVIGHPKTSSSWFDRRYDLVKRFAWSVTDPDTVQFVADHADNAFAKNKIIDPMAGTGYWAYLLGQLGVEVASYDESPGTDTHHHSKTLFVPVGEADVALSVPSHYESTLFLSWPPMSDAGFRALMAYTGTRVIYIGEGPGGCTGDERMHGLLDELFTLTATHSPITWWGLHDRVEVYDRKTLKGVPVYGPQAGA